jgi:MFS family permease
MSRTFWITLFIAFTNSLSFTILIPILYLYGREFGLSDFQTSLLFAVYSVAQFFSTPVIGQLSDRLGRKPLLIISLAGTVVANLMAGLAGAAWMLFAARILDGLTGGNVSVAQAIVADVTQPEERAKAFGLFGAITFGLGFIVGPLLSLLAQQRSLGTGFLVASLFAAIALGLTVVALPETLKPQAESGLDQLPAPRLGVTAASSDESLKDQGDSGLSASRSSRQRQRGARAPFDLGLSRLVTGLFLPKIGILLVINFLIGTTFTIFTFAFQPYFLKVLGQDNQGLTLLFTTFGLLSVLVQAKGISWLSQRISVVTILFLGLALRSLTFVLMPIFPNLAYFVTVSVVFSVFNALVQPTLTTLISLNATPDTQGSALGLNSSYLNVSNAFGPIIAGALVNAQYPHTYAYPLYVSGVLTASVLAFAVAKRRAYAA